MRMCIFFALSIFGIVNLVNISKRQSLGNCTQSRGLKFRSTDESQTYICRLETEESFGTCLVD